jgi:ADP-ribose pyrophosphatase YjhB (NUDIX family)
MNLPAVFDYCPRCGTERTGGADNPFHCATCGHTQYFNPAVAVAAILLDPDGRILLLRRAKDPGKGKLGLPGGFVDIDETAEDALRREIHEEVNLAVGSSEFLCTLPNEYHYKGVTYPVLDLFFVARASVLTGIAALDGVESLLWVAPAQVDLREIAFPSNAEALRRFIARR